MVWGAGCGRCWGRCLSPGRTLRRPCVQLGAISAPPSPLTPLHREPPALARARLGHSHSASRDPGRTCAPAHTLTHACTHTRVHCRRLGRCCPARPDPRAAGPIDGDTPTLIHRHTPLRASRRHTFINRPGEVHTRTPSLPTLSFGSPESSLPPHRAPPLPVCRRAGAGALGGGNRSRHTHLPWHLPQLGASDTQPRTSCRPGVRGPECLDGGHRPGAAGGGASFS